MKNLISISNTPYLYIVLFYCLITYTAQAQWVQQGPGPSENGQVENLPSNNEVVGAIQCVTPHPTDANILYVGAVNGGVWRTQNATSATPEWEFISADLPSPSIGALEFDPADPTNQTLIVGIDRTSAFNRRGAGDWGIFRTTNGGGSWTNIDPNGNLPNNIGIKGIAAQGSTIVVATPVGVFRTTNTGANWNYLNNNASVGLPSGIWPAFDIVQNPSSPTNLYTHAGSMGIYQSLDMGATWTKISNQSVDLALDGGINVEFAVGSFNNLFVGIITSGALSGLFRTLDGGYSWTTLDIPQTNEGGTAFGIHVNGQGAVHFSMAADPNNANVVYVGGDSQPASGDVDTLFPNSIGANNFTGRLFRVNASLPNGSQATTITHVGTENNSAPHADSRDMDFDANGDLIEGDDGGVYKQSSPINDAGDWSSLNGNLSVSEIYSSDWDAVSNIVITGLQDNGVSEQNLSTNSTWRNLRGGDGGDVAVDDISGTDFSNRYYSAQEMSGFRRRVYGTDNELIAVHTPSLRNIATDTTINILGLAQVNPIKLNSQNGARLLINTNNGLFESFDQGNNVMAVPGITVNVNHNGRDAIAYGAADNRNIIYAGSIDDVFIRTEFGESLEASSAYFGGIVQGISIDPDDSQSAYVIDDNQVFETTNTGASWSDVTGNLPLLNPGELITIAYIPNNGNDKLAIGSELGVFVADGPNFNNWERLGLNLPMAAVYDLEYDVNDDILLAATLGRGAWTWNFSERDPVNVVLALDFSGSMLYNACPNCDPKINVLKEAVEIFMQLWKGIAVEDDRIGVIYFQTDVDSYGLGNTGSLFSVIEETDEMIEEINAKITTSSQKTAMGGGLQQAINGLTNASRPRNIILFTDGMQNVNPGIDFPNLTIENGVFNENSNVSATSPLTQLNTDLGIKINTIGVGATQPFETQLEDIARGTEGITKITTTPDDDLRQFFVEELVDVLRDFSPQLVDYRKNTFINYTTEVFNNVNTSAKKAIFKVSYDKGDKVIVRIRKGDEDVTSLAQFIDGDFYQIFSFPFEKLHLLQGPEYVGSWQLYLESSKKVDYEIALIADEAIIDYDLSVGGPYRVGDPLKLSAKIFINDIPTLENIEVTAVIDHPKEGLGNLLSTIPVTGKSSVTLEPNQKLGAQKLARLYQDVEFLKRMRPDKDKIALEASSDRIFRASFNKTIVPGNYTITFYISGTHPFTGPFKRIEKQSVIVRFGEFDFEPTDISKRAEGTSIVWTYKMIPRDKYGNFLGPDFGDMLQIKSSVGDIQRIIDNGDGSYSFEVMTNDGEEPKIEVGIR